MSKLSVLTAAIAASLFSFQAQATVIDNFDDPTLPIVAFAGASASATTLGGMMGGERDIYIESFGATDLVTAQVSGSKFRYGQSGDSLGRATLQWDGTDGNATSLDTNGLGGANLLSGGANGITFTVYSDGGSGASPDAEITTTIYAADGIRFATYTFLAVDTFIEITDSILFSDPAWVFNGGMTAADFASIGAVQIVMNVNGDNASLDVVLDTIETTFVPEPASILLTGLALTGLGAISRRRKTK